MSPPAMGLGSGEATSFFCRARVRCWPTASLAECPMLDAKRSFGEPNELRNTFASSPKVAHAKYFSIIRR